MEEVKNLPEVVNENKSISIGNQSPMAAMELALNKDMDIDKLEKILALQEKWEQMEAKKAYTQAMADFKSDPPRVNKDKKVSFNQTNYKHASLGNVTEKINRSLANHGLSAAWKTDQSQSGITVTCTITHKMGYSESTALTSGADMSGKKNNIQAIGSTITYLQRYTILSLTGLATHDQDDDGRGTQPVKYIDEKQVSQITDMINSIENFSEDSFLSWARIESIEMMPVYDFGKNLNALGARAKAGQK